MKTKTYKNKRQLYYTTGLKVKQNGYCRPIILNKKEAIKFIASEMIRLNPDIDLQQLLGF